VDGFPGNVISLYAKGMTTADIQGGIRIRREVPLRDLQIAARHADRRTTTVYGHRRQNRDRHAAYAVVAFVTTADRARGVSVSFRASDISRCSFHPSRR